MGSRFGSVSGPKRGGSQRRSVLGLLSGSESGPVAGPVLDHFWILSLAGSGGVPPASGRPGGPAAGPGKKAARAEGWRRTAPRPQHSAPRCTAPRPRCTAPRRAARRCTAVACAPLRLNRVVRVRCLSQAGAAPPRWTRDRNAPAAWLGVGAERKPCKRGPITVRDYALVGPTELFLEIPRLDPLKTSSHPPAGCTPPPLPHKLRFRASTAWLGGAETQVPVAFLRILLPRWCDMSPPPLQLSTPYKNVFRDPWLAGLLETRTPLTYNFTPPTGVQPLTVRCTCPVPASQARCILHYSCPALASQLRCICAAGGIGSQRHCNAVQCSYATRRARGGHFDAGSWLLSTVRSNSGLVRRVGAIYTLTDLLLQF